VIKNNDIFLSFINGNLTEKAKKEEKNLWFRKIVRVKWGKTCLKFNENWEKKLPKTLNLQGKSVLVFVYNVKDEIV
jgi:hypothetical protein